MGRDDCIAISVQMNSFEMPQNEYTQNEVPQIEEAATSKRARSTLKKTTELPQNEAHIISINSNSKKDENTNDLLSRAWKEFLSHYKDEASRITVLDSMVSKTFSGNFFPPRKVMENLVVISWLESKLC